MTVVGLGAQDTLREAEEFVDRFELTLPMVWDASFQTWAELGVSLQPSAMLFTADGQFIERWLGRIPEAEVLAVANGVAEPGGDQVGNQSFCRFADRYISAHAEFEAYASAPEDRQQRVLDDIRFASNAMSQTAPQDVLAPVEDLAAANRALVALIVDADFEIDPADDDERSRLVTQRAEALDALATPVRNGCDVVLPTG